jgi:hypothetical protein
MGKTTDLTPNQIDEAVVLYREGHKQRVITEMTGLSQGQLYYHLEKRGVMPTRQKRPQVDARKVMDRLERLEETLVRVEQALEESTKHPNGV